MIRFLIRPVGILLFVLLLTAGLGTSAVILATILILTGD